MGFSEAPLDCIELKTGPQERVPDASVIWLHGLGADGNDFVPVVPELQLPEGIRFVFPHAPIRPITLNNGYMMRGWYDLASLEVTDNQDDAGLINSVQVIEGFVRREMEKGIAPERIILAGFSQGGAVVLYAGLTIDIPIGGIMALSTYLPLVETLKDKKTDYRPPIFMGHGQQDDVIQYAYGRESADQLIEWGYPLEWHDYPMPHSVCREEIEDIRTWLLSRLG